MEANEFVSRCFAKCHVIEIKEIISHPRHMCKRDDLSFIVCRMSHVHVGLHWTIIKQYCYEIYLV